ncbi:MAG: hypothetical protein JNL39_12690 [Opitutaceae bacterium]|nr:hypothetical protein [Opitutaceae bacterium]
MWQGGWSGLGEILPVEEEASISFGPLRIWIHGRQFPDSTDYWDGNWLLVKARCVGDRSQVEAVGAILRLDELRKWKEDLVGLHTTLRGEVSLPAIEPQLTVKISAPQNQSGALTCEVSLSSEPISENHSFRFFTDQSYLPGLVLQLSSVLREYPIKGTP